MTLKKKVAVNIAIAFSLLFAVVAFVVYLMFSSFREEEFRASLEEKALNTARLMAEVKSVDKQVLKLFDRNTIYRLYNEKTLVFDKDFNLIYSSIDDASIKWDKEDLRKLKRERHFFRKENEKELLGVYYNLTNTEYYVLIAAEDIYGNSKLKYLLTLLITSFSISVVIIWISSYYITKRMLLPLDQFEKRITTITANELDMHLEESEKDDEINLLARAFNRMLGRIEAAFKSQREFTSNASHELRTPLTRLAFQLENLIQTGGHTERTVGYLQNLLLNVHQLSDLVNSLLLLTELGHQEFEKSAQKERVDEIIFSAYEQVKNQYPDFDLVFEISEDPVVDNPMEIRGIKNVLEIAFVNLLKNACIYSGTHQAGITVYQDSPKKLRICIMNGGPTLKEKDINNLFQPFVRGENAAKTYGSGLGLRITKGILDLHHAAIQYSINDSGQNQFDVIFTI